MTEHDEWDMMNLFLFSVEQKVFGGPMWFFHCSINIWLADNITYYILLPAMDMAKVGGPLSVVKVCTYMLSAKIGYR